MLNGSRVAKAILYEGTANKKYNFSPKSITALMFVTDCLMAQEQQKTLTDCHWFYDHEHGCVEPVNVKIAGPVSWLRGAFSHVSAQEKVSFIGSYPILEKVADKFVSWNEDEILDFIRGVPLVKTLKMSDSHSIHPLDYFYRKGSYISLPNGGNVLRPQFKKSANPLSIVSNDTDNVVPFKKPSAG